MYINHVKAFGHYPADYGESRKDFKEGGNQIPPFVKDLERM